MKTKIIDAAAIRQLVRKVGRDRLMDEMIDRLTASFRNFDSAKTDVPARDGFKYSQPTVGLVEWMPSMNVGSNATIKVVGYHPRNPEDHGLPTIISTVSRYDTHTGHLVGLMDGTLLTALRTGAASAVASRMLASGDAATIGLIGCGAQAVTQLHALSRVFKIDRVLVYDIDRATMDSFYQRVSFIGLDSRQVRGATPSEIVSESDVTTTATSVEVGAGPVFDDVEPRPWLHVNAVGSDFPGKTEIPDSFLKRSFVCPEFLEQAINEGECQQLTSCEIGASLVEVLKAPDDFKQLKEQLTVFDSTGWAFEDQIAMDMILELAHDLNIGHSVAVECIESDPKNPYHSHTAES